MSRPFSYNDENFTVIDNILFVHFMDNKSHEINEPVIQVPDEFYKRMCSYGNVVLISALTHNTTGYITGITIVEEDNKRYIAFTEKRQSTNAIRYHYSIYLLKDI